MATNEHLTLAVMILVSLCVGCVEDGQQRPVASVSVYRTAQAEDLVQGFLTRLLEKKDLAHVDRGVFRRLAEGNNAAYGRVSSMIQSPSIPLQRLRERVCVGSVR